MPKSRISQPLPPRRQVCVLLALALALLLTTSSLSASTLTRNCVVDSGKLYDVQFTEFLEQDRPQNGNCDGFSCYQPEQPGSPFLRLAEPTCDPQAGLCTVQLVVPLEFPGNEQTLSLSSGVISPYVYWFEAGAPPEGCEPWVTLDCGETATCGTPGLGGQIRSDVIETFLSINASCGDLSSPFFRQYSLEAFACPVGSACPETLEVGGLDLSPAALAAFLDCPRPRTEDCTDCRACRQVGPGGVGIGGPPPIVGPGDSGPGAMLRYAAGGAGSDGLPGSADWATVLGTGWAHTYAQRIVPDPDDSHVWLITERAVFREFGNLTGGIYTTLAPSDEYRTLERTGIGWLLHDLDGTVTEFDSAGIWLSTTDRNGNATTGTYSGGQLTEVTFPDLRTETFTYHPDGKLASITEVGIDGTTTRTWSYTWTGGDLTRIDRPDGTAWEMTYGDAAHPGYMTLLELIGSDVTLRRVEAAWEYDTEGRVKRTWRGATDVTSGVDTWELTYDSASQTTVTDPLGQRAIYTYEPDPAGYDQIRVTDIAGPCPGCGLASDTQFQYTDPANPLLPTQQTDALGNVTMFEYDADGMTLSRTEAANSSTLARTTTWEHDAIYPALVTKTIRPSVAGAPDGRVTLITRDAQGNPTTRTEEGFEDGAAFSLPTVTTFTADGQPETIDPPGYGTTDVTTFTYDATRGGLIADSRTDPLIGTTTFEHDPYHRRTRTTDPNGIITETEYDALNRVRFLRQLGTTPSDTSDDLITEHAYTPFGDLDHTILPEGNVIDYSYDAAGRLTTIERRPDLTTHGERTVYQLDAAGNRTREEHQTWDGTQWVTESFTDYLFTTRCHLDQIQHADGSVTEYAFDCNGNLEKVWDANHPSNNQTDPATTTYGYDELDRLTTVTRPWAGAGGGTTVTTYQYDAQDHLTTVTDAEGNETTYTYSDRDLLTREVSPVSGTTTHTYNDHGALTSTTDARGITVTRTVDELDRVTFVDYPDDTLDTTHVYDDPAVPFSLGRLTAITRDGHTVAYSYDQYGRTVQDGELSYQYDRNGNRTTITYPDTVTATMTHDFADRATTLSVTTPSGSTDVITAASYLPSGPLTTLTFGTGVTETRTFDQRYFPASIALDAARDRTWTYTQDAVGNVTGIVSSLACAGDVTLSNQTVTGEVVEDSCAGLHAGPAYTVDTGADVTFRAATRVVLSDGFSVKSGASFTAGVDPSLSGDVTRSYTYQDVEYFLTEATGPWGTKSWTFDKIGNRLTETDGDGTDTYSYTQNPAAGNTALLDSIALPTLGSRDYSYSDAGHQTRVASSTGGNVVDFTYGNDGRLSRADRTGADPTPFLYDGRSFLRHAGDLATTGTVQPLYDSGGLLHGLLRQPSDTDPETRYLIFYLAGRPVAQVALETSQPDRWWYFHTDHLGTPLVATDGVGEELWTNRFEPYGRDMDAGLAVGALESGVFLRFPGQWEDGVWREATMGTERVYNLHRWYEPRTGRYSRADPLGLRQTLHPYWYVAANPMRWTDPNGLAIYVCSRRAFVTPVTPYGVGNHSYIWDDRDGVLPRQRYCGVWSEADESDRGPGIDACNYVPGSDGREDQIMDCCRQIKADPGGIYFPPFNDCQKGTADALECAEVRHPGVPGDRIGPPCDECTMALDPEEREKPFNPGRPGYRQSPL